MQKPEKAVIQNTVYIALWQVVLVALMQAVYLIWGKWNLTVLYSGLLSSAVAVANFFAMAMAVQKAVGLKEKDAAAKLKLSHSLRFMALIAFAVVGCLLFDPLASVIPLVFPRFAIMLYPIFSKKKEESQQ